MHIAFKKNLAFPIVVLGSRYYFKVIWNEFFQEVRAWNMSFFGDVIWLQGQVIFIADDHPMQLYPQCSVMMRNLKKC